MPDKADKAAQEAAEKYNAERAAEAKARGEFYNTPPYEFEPAADADTTPVDKPVEGEPVDEEAAAKARGEFYNTPPFEFEPPVEVEVDPEFGPSEEEREELRKAEERRAKDAEQAEDQRKIEAGQAVQKTPEVKPEDSEARKKASKDSE